MRNQPASLRPPLAPLAWRFVAVLLAAGVLLAVTSVGKIDLQPVIPRAAREQVPAAAPAPAPVPAQTNFPAILQRPLFFATRKPWQPPPPPKPPVVVPSPPKLTGYTAVGIVTSGNTSLVVIKTKNGKSIVLYEGDKMDGWTLQNIAGDRLRFMSGTTSFEMTLPKPSGRTR